MAAKAEPEPGAPRRRPWYRRRLATLPLLLMGGLLAFAPLSGALPSERQIHLRLKRPDGVERVQLVWLDEGEPLRRTDLMVEGSAELRTRLRIPDGSYELELRVTRRGGVEQTTRRVDFDDQSEVVTIFVD